MKSTEQKQKPEEVIFYEDPTKGLMHDLETEQEEPFSPEQKRRMREAGARRARLKSKRSLATA